MPRVTIGVANPDADDFVSILEGYKTATVTLASATSATFTVGGVAYTFTGTGFAVAAGKLSAGTITGISSSVSGQNQFAITKLSLTAANLNAAVAAEGTDPLALEHLLSSQDWIITGSNAVNTSTPGLLTGSNIWYMYGGNDVAGGAESRDQFYGGDGDDSLAGNGGNDALSGEAGNDILSGGVGNDFIYGGTGGDTLSGGDGHDTLYGGDTLDTASNTVSGGNGHDTINDGNGAGVINGDAGNDRVRGYAGNDTIDGGANDDILRGEAGNDSVAGGTGNDQLIDGAGNDTLSGGADNDRLQGGVGKDSLHGGAGVDTFVFGAADSGLHHAADEIADFTSGTDKISLVGLSLDFVGTNGFTAGTADAEVRYSTVDHRLEIDLNGDDTADAHIVVQVGATVALDDLIL